MTHLTVRQATKTARRHPWVLVLALVLGSVAPRARADQPAPDADQCIAFHVAGQAERASGRLLDAQASLKQCLHPACSPLLRNDCASLLETVERETPSVVLAARVRGTDLLDVTVREGGTVVATRLDGRPVQLDPGPHELTFEAVHTAPLTLSIVVRAGEQHRLVAADLRERAQEPPAQSPAQPAPTVTPARPDRAPAPFLARVRPWDWALLGASVGLGAGALGLGLAARADEREALAECAPACSHSRTRAIRRKGIAADTLLGLAAASLVAVTLDVSLRRPSRTRVSVLLGPTSLAGSLSF